MDNFKIIYRILKHLEASMDCVETNTEVISHTALGISYERWEQLLIMLQENQYITGIQYAQTLSEDKAHIIKPIYPAITLRGLEYLSENTTTMQRVARLLKGIKEATPGI